jgi:cellulose synthase/poly-beta-1,6-N-acetylglucosamine synthase-like glycosyltransferase
MNRPPATMLAMAKFKGLPVHLNWKKKVTWFQINSLCVIVVFFLLIGNALVNSFKFFISHPEFSFLFLFIFRYFRLIVHMVAFWGFYKPTEIPESPTLTPGDVTVIVPTVDPNNKDFEECLRTCLANNPRELIIVVGRRQLLGEAANAVARFRTDGCKSTISVTFTESPNKRRQVIHAVEHVKTPIVVFLDDHVFWPSPNFLRSVLAPFEDPKVGGVGTNKRVRRTETGFTTKSFWNMIGALYLERNNFNAGATNAVDGGMSCISGRTSVHRTQVLQQKEFMDGFKNERFFFGIFGPLDADDDKYITRYYVRKGYAVKFQICEDALIETTLGEFPKYLSQCVRWARTTWRSNPASLFTDRSVWKAQPWCVYAVHLTGFVNFSLFYDAALLYSYSHSSYYHALGGSLKYLVLWVLAGKTAKSIPHFVKEPRDLVFLPGYYAFTYFHSFIKLYALFTFWDTNWSGRQLDQPASA